MKGPLYFCLSHKAYCKIYSHWAASSSLIVWVYLHSNFRRGVRKLHVFWTSMRNGRSRSSNVVDFGTNRKSVCDFLLAISSNLVPIFPRFRDIAGFLLRRATPPLFYPNFRGVLIRLDCLRCGSKSEDPMLIISVINVELVKPICSRYVNVTDGQRDR